MSHASLQDEPKLISRSNDITGDSNFPQGCEISPDGLCVLTSTASDNLLRLYNVLNDDILTTTASATVATSSGDDNDSNASVPSALSQPNPSIWKKALIAREGDSVRSYCWYPLMNSYHPSSCAFLTSSREQPIHLIDAYTSQIRASYRPYNGLDEMESPNVVTFTPDGSRIFAAGFKTDRMIQVFDTAIPGRDATTLRLGKTRRSKDGQKGIVSALAFPNGNNMLCGTGQSNVFAVGAYSPGSIYIYDDRRPSGDPAGTILHGGMCIVGHGKSFTRKKRRFVDISSGNNEIGVDNEDRQGEDINDLFSMAKVNWYQSRARGGITQLQWSTGSDFFLYSASRRSDAVLAWDMRVLTGSDSHPIRGIMSFPRESDTNQRLEFDLNEDGTKLFTASKDKCVKIYDAKNGTLLKRIDGFDDVVNGVSFKTDTTGKGLLAVAAGARRFTEVYDNEEDNGETMSKTALCDDGDQRRTSHDPPGSLSLYHL